MNRRRWHALENLIRANGYTRGVELGVYKGETFKYLLANLPGLFLTGVDRFDTRHYHATREGRPPKSFDLDYERRQIQSWIDQHAPARGRLIVRDTVLASEYFGDQTLDFIFVDADHRYEAVCADLDAWIGKVRPGGSVYGHDWNEIEFPGVVNAVLQKFPRHDIALHADHVWSIRL